MKKSHNIPIETPVKGKYPNLTILSESAVKTPEILYVDDTHIRKDWALYVHYKKNATAYLYFDDYFHGLDQLFI